MLVSQTSNLIFLQKVQVDCNHFSTNNFKPNCLLFFTLLKNFCPLFQTLILETFGSVKLAQCKVVGTKDVTIEWKPVAWHVRAEDREPFVINYTLFYCKSQSCNISVDYEVGCSIMDTGFSLQCNIGNLLKFDFPSNESPFYYYIQAMNSKGTMTSISNIFECNYNLKSEYTFCFNVCQYYIYKYRYSNIWLPNS